MKKKIVQGLKRKKKPPKPQHWAHIYIYKTNTRQLKAEWTSTGLLHLLFLIGCMIAQLFNVILSKKEVAFAI